MLEHLVSEEMENLSEEEMNELFGGIGRRLGAWKAGRERKGKVKEWEAFKGNLGHKLNQLADMYEKAHQNHNADIEKNPKLKQFASTFEPWKKADKGVEDQVKALRTQANSVLNTPVEVSPDETPEQAGERTGQNVPEPTPPTRRTAPPATDPPAEEEEERQGTPVVNPEVTQNANRETNEDRKRLIKKAQKLLKENKKIRVVK